MEVILFLIILSVFVAGGFLIAFLWAVRSGQYDDTYAPSVRILFDERSPEEENNETKDTNNETNKDETEK